MTLIAIHLETRSGSRAWMIATVISGFWHLLLAILGTFVLKRFPTSFAIGFLVGMLLVGANQNVILFGILHGYPYGNSVTHHIYATACCLVAMVLCVVASLLLHFRNFLVVAPMDLLGTSTTMDTMTTSSMSVPTPAVVAPTTMTMTTSTTATTSSTTNTAATTNRSTISRRV
jgi:hypothetical protein